MTLKPGEAILILILSVSIFVASSQFINIAKTDPERATEELPNFFQWIADLLGWFARKSAEDVTSPWVWLSRQAPAVIVLAVMGYLIFLVATGRR